MTFDALLNIILIAFAVGIVVSLYRLHRDEHYKKFNLVDLITAHDGKVSRPACLETGAWLISSWGFVVFVHKGTIPDWYVTSYLTAFVLRAAHAAHLAHQEQQQKETT